MRAPHGATAGADDELSKQKQNNSQLMEKLDKQVMEINRALDDYTKLNDQVEATISGLNNLGLYFVNLQNSLISTKKLIAGATDEFQRTRAKSESTRAENERLKGLLAMDKSKLNELLIFMDEEKRWQNRLESLFISIIGSAVVAVAGTWLVAYRKL